MKVFQIEQNGFVWQFPARVIAEDRAKYYSDKEEETDYEEEFQYTMDSEFELSDWFFNNMNWEDVAKDAKIIKAPQTPVEPDMGEEMEHEILEVEDE